MLLGSCVATMREASSRTLALESESRGRTSSLRAWDFASSGPSAAIAASCTRWESLRQCLSSGPMCVSSGYFARTCTAR